MEKLNAQLKNAIAAQMPGMENVLVYGEGPIKPRLMLIGEAPGEQETLLGRPFVGKAGKNLDHFLELARLKREEIYISNVVKYRPTKVGKTGRLSNRPPTKEEIEVFAPWLLSEIERVEPQMIVTLGNVPLKTLTDPKATIGEMHGRILAENRANRPLYALYHPASLIYNRALAPVYEEDVLALAQILQSSGV